MSCHQVFFFPQGKVLKEIHAILTETLGEHALLYATVKNWVAQFKRGDFSMCDAPHLHELILQDCQILAKSITEQLGISCEWVGSIIHEDVEAVHEVGPKIPECRSKTSMVPVV